MTAADVPAVVEQSNAIVAEEKWITRQTGEEFVEADFLKLFDVADCAQFVATIDSEIVGLVRLRKEADGRLFVGMSVGKSYRRQGVGNALLDAAIEWARERASKLYLTVYSHNVPAISLYRRKGFTQVEYRPNHCVRQSGEVWHLITMVRDLNDGVAEEESA